ncbi:uncharacterized protein LOC144421101 [Styela clava]
MGEGSSRDWEREQKERRQKERNEQRQYQIKINQQNNRKEVKVLAENHRHKEVMFEKRGDLAIKMYHAHIDAHVKLGLDGDKRKVAIQFEEIQDSSDDDDDDADEETT